jgi:DNA repair protein RecO (recombination protein O)
MPVYNDEGIVLRTYSLGEADRIITILTREHGKVRAVAKGVRREKSRFGARLEPFMRNQLQLYQGRSDLQIISQAVCIGPYAHSIMTDFPSYEAATLMAEVADDLIGDDQEPSTAQYLLFVGAISALSRHLHTPWQIAQSYVLRALSLAGWRPQLNSCVTCGRTDAQVPLTNFSVADGGVQCRDHHTPDSIPLAKSDRELLCALARGDWDKCSAKPSMSVEHVVEMWARYYLDRPLHSASLIDSNYGF